MISRIMKLTVYSTKSEKEFIMRVSQIPPHMICKTRDLRTEVKAPELPDWTILAWPNDK